MLLKGNSSLCTSAAQHTGASAAATAQPSSRKELFLRKNKWNHCAKWLPVPWCEEIDREEEFNGFSHVSGLLLSVSVLRLPAFMSLSIMLSWVHAEAKAARLCHYLFSHLLLCSANDTQVEKMSYEPGSLVRHVGISIIKKEGKLC